MQQTQNLEFGAFVRLFNRRKTVHRSVTLAMTVFMVLMAFVLPPRYSGTAIVMQDTRKSRITNLEDVLSGLGTDTGAIRSEIDIIGSRTMIARVVDKMGLMKDPIYNRALNVSWLSPATGFAHSARTRSPKSRTPPSALP
ncbi:MAG: Wzz/FepE/Etk N-terminal domain-containing protein [Alphaproteobacteria bacterium]